MRSSDVVAIILCAGRGTRAGLGYNKALFALGEAKMVAVAAKKFARFDRLILVCNEADVEEIKCNVSIDKAEFILGGETRTDSVRNALKAVGEAAVVLIHDGARPYVNEKTINDSVESAIRYGSGVTAVKSTNALKSVSGDVATSLDRSSIYVVQTPQTFRYAEIVDAYERVSGSYADDSEVYERAGYKTHLVEGSYDNIKLTTPSDFMGLNGVYRIGYGYDVHRFSEGRRLVLCGKTFDYPRGLLGHSDADAPVHALMDALLSAAGLPDIGVLFPDNDDAYLGADSMVLLNKVMEKITEFSVVNASVCIMAQAPKMSPHIAEMRANLAKALSVSVDAVNISATTTESLGIVGEGKGLAASATVLLSKK